MSYDVQFQNALVNFTYLLEYSEATCPECSIFISWWAITKLSLYGDGYYLKAKVMGAHVFKEVQDHEQSSEGK